jgi:hypothetical protein
MVSPQIKKLVEDESVDAQGYIDSTPNPYEVEVRVWIKFSEPLANREVVADRVKSCPSR